MYQSAVNKPLFAFSLLWFLYLSSCSLHRLWFCLGEFVCPPEKTTSYAGWGVSHRVCPFLPGAGVGWGGREGGGMVEGIPPIPACIFMPLHFPLLFFAFCPLKQRLPCFYRQSRLLLNL